MHDANAYMAVLQDADHLLMLAVNVAYSLQRDMGDGTVKVLVFS